MYITNGFLFCDDGVFRSMDLEINNGRISNIGSNIVQGNADTLDATNCYVVPGFIDIHIHGALGVDFSDGSASSIQTMSQFLLSRGVTSFLGTSMALPGDRLSDIYRTARPYICVPIHGGATLRGINMEGPFFNLEKRGAQNPEYIIPPDFELFLSLNEDSGGNIRTVAVAPETKNGLDFVEKASTVCNVSLAHSCASYDVARQAFLRGANHVTHIFNGMPPFHHRDPGIVGAVAETNAYVELICDGIHIHPAVVQSIFRLFGDDHVCLISDAMRACGMPEGEYDLGGQKVTVSNGCATIDTGSLAGSITVLTDCFRKAVQFGVPLESALKAVTVNPARSVGLDDELGTISRGKEADLLIIDRSLSIKHIIARGQLYRP